MGAGGLQEAAGAVDGATSCTVLAPPTPAYSHP